MKRATLPANITPEELDALAPRERQAIEDQIAELDVATSDLDLAGLDEVGQRSSHHPISIATAAFARVA